MQSDLEDARRRLQAAQADIARLGGNSCSNGAKARQAEELRQIGGVWTMLGMRFTAQGERKRRGIDR